MFKHLNILHYFKYIGCPLSLQVRHSSVNLLFLLLILLIASGMFYGGYWLGQKPPVVTEQSLEAKSSDPEVQRLKKELHDLTRSTNQVLAVFTARLARLKTHVIRLEAYGIRLVNMSKLDPSEFNLYQSPATGGPEPRTLVPLDVRVLSDEIDSIARTLRDREVTIKALEEQFMNRILARKALPRGKPVNKSRISSYFGVRRDPFTRARKHHGGMDFAAPRGTPIYAVADGIVSASERRAGYGNIVEVDHGKYITRYAHNLKNIAKVGQKVRKGQLVALVGKTGKATGYHLHFEVLSSKGRPMNPLPFVRGRRPVQALNQ